MDRGFVLEVTESGNLPQTFPVIDRVGASTQGGYDVTSIRSLDPRADGYDYGEKFEKTVGENIDTVAEFDAATLKGVEIHKRDIDTRRLDLVIRPESLTVEQHKVLEQAVKSAHERGVKLVVKERP